MTQPPPQQPPFGQPDPTQPPQWGPGPYDGQPPWQGWQPPTADQTTQFPPPAYGQGGAPGFAGAVPGYGQQGQVMPPYGQQAFPGPVPAAGAKPWFQRKRVLIPAGVVALAIIGGAIGGNGSSDRTSVAAATTSASVSTSSAPISPRITLPPVATPAATTPAVTTPAPTTAAPVVTTPAPPPAPSVSVSQQNAVRTANSYLDYTAFSREGLIGQLEYEGFSTDDATFAVDTITVDWNAQAAAMAVNYLDYTSFSRSGLIDQLVYEGFTPEQAEYGVSQTGL